MLSNDFTSFLTWGLANDVINIHRSQLVKDQIYIIMDKING